MQVQALKVVCLGLLLVAAWFGPTYIPAVAGLCNTIHDCEIARPYSPAGE